MATEHEIFDCLKTIEDGLEATLRGNKLSADSKAVYVTMLATTPGEVLYAAALLILSKATWLPTPGQLLEACRDVQLASQPVHDWETGYMYCRKACRYFGDMQAESAISEIAKYDALAARTIQRLGWAAFFFCPQDEEQTFKAQFRDSYNVMVKREQYSLQIPAHVSDKIKQVSAAMSATARLAAPKN